MPPVMASRAKWQDSGCEVARPAVSSDSGYNNIQQSTSINDLSRDVDGIRLGTGPETPRPRSDTLREAERRQWQEQEIARRQEEDAARLAQEQAARRQWDIDQELDRRAREESRRRTEYERSQRIKNAALDAARQAAAYNPQSSRYRESSQPLSSLKAPNAEVKPVKHLPSECLQCNKPCAAGRNFCQYSCKTIAEGGAPKLIAIHSGHHMYRRSESFPSPIFSA
jgi:hypothetical protein